MVKLNDVYKKEDANCVSRIIVDEVVIMPLCRSEEDMQYIYSISDKAGVRIWQLLDGSHSARDIQEVLKREFQGKAEAIERGVLAFLEDLLSIKLIEKSKQGKTPDIEKRASRNDTRSSLLSTRSSNKKKPYKTPEIAKVKMQPEQAVLACCTYTLYSKQVDTTIRCADNEQCFPFASCGIGDQDGVMETLFT